MKKRRLLSVLSPKVPRQKAGLTRITSQARDVAWTSLNALQQSADCFPPLKSVVGGVLVIWDIAERMKMSRKTAQVITCRCVAILEAIADAIPDPAHIPPALLDQLNRFSVLLIEIHTTMIELETRSRMIRFMSVNRDEEMLKQFLNQLEDTYQMFMIASNIRIELAVSTVHREVLSVKQELKVTNTQVKYQVQDSLQTIKLLTAVVFLA